LFKDQIPKMVLLKLEGETIEDRIEVEENNGNGKYNLNRLGTRFRRNDTCTHGKSKTIGP